MDLHWYLEKSVLEAILKNSDKFEASEVKAFFMEMEDASKDDKYRLIDKQAHIDIVGVLSFKPFFMAAIFGGGNSVYSNISESILAAEADPEVQEIVLNITSPGGTVAGMADTANIIAECKKKVTANVIEFAYSAAYGLASQADEIIVNNDMAMVGSIGVASEQYIEDYVKIITSTDAPNKIPDASTKAGEKIIRAELDQIHDKFVEMIARGRSKALKKKITAETVNQDFGRGGRVIAEKALTQGMIDEINQNLSAIGAAESNDVALSSENNSEKTEVKKPKITGGKKMDLETLKSEHPDLYAKIKKEGFEAGVASEHDRVKAHLTAGTNCNAMDYAVKCIQEGEDYSKQSVQAEYLSAGMKKNDVNAREEDNAESLETEDAADENAVAKNLLDKVMGKSNKTGSVIPADSI